MISRVSSHSQENLKGGGHDLFDGIIKVKCKIVPVLN
jgi:hypothetical protein